MTYDCRSVKIALEMGSVAWKSVIMCVMFPFTFFWQADADKSIACGIPSSRCRGSAINCVSGNIIVNEGYYVQKAKSLNCSVYLKTCNVSNAIDNCCEPKEADTRKNFSMDVLESARKECDDRTVCQPVNDSARPQDYIITVVDYSCIVGESGNIHGTVFGALAATGLVAIFVVTLYCLTKRVKKRRWGRSVGVSYKDPVASYDYIIHEAPSGRNFTSPRDDDNEEYNHLNVKDVKVNNHYDTPESAAQKLRVTGVDQRGQGVVYSYDHLQGKVQKRVETSGYDVMTLGMQDHSQVQGDCDSTYNTTGDTGTQITLQNVYDTAVHVSDNVDVQKSKLKESHEYFEVMPNVNGVGICCPSATAREVEHADLQMPDVKSGHMNGHHRMLTTRTDGRSAYTQAGPMGGDLPQGQTVDDSHLKSDKLGLVTGHVHSACDVDAPKSPKVSKDSRNVMPSKIPVRDKAKVK